MVNAAAGSALMRRQISKPSKVRQVHVEDQHVGSDVELIERLGAAVRLADVEAATAQQRSQCPPQRLIVFDIQNRAQRLSGPHDKLPSAG